MGVGPPAREWSLPELPNPDGSSSARKIRLPKASNMLANELRARILEEELPAGTAFPSETELIEAHGLSRATVREALRLLEVDGFISIQRGPHGGITVQHPTVDVVSLDLATLLTLDSARLSSIFEFRRLVEPAAAAAAARDATDEERQLLLDITGPDATRAAGVRFHLLLANCVDNELYRVILSATHKILQWHNEMVPDSGLEDDQDKNPAHAKIAQLIAEGDADAAAASMRRHLASFESKLRAGHLLEVPVLPRTRWIQRLRQNHV